MIRKIQHLRQVSAKTNDYSKKKHLEKHLVTTWYFLFIPIFTFSKVLDANI